MVEDHYVDPTRESFDAFKALPRDVPINMLNLLRFHEQEKGEKAQARVEKGGSQSPGGCSDIPVDSFWRNRRT